MSGVSAKTGGAAALDCGHAGPGVVASRMLHDRLCGGGGGGADGDETDDSYLKQIGHHHMWREDIARRERDMQGRCNNQDDTEGLGELMSGFVFPVELKAGTWTERDSLRKLMVMLLPMCW